MTTYQAFADFTAQGANVKALGSLYSNLKKSGTSKIELTPIVVFLAFAIEAYLNSLGARHLSIWDELERLPWKTKIEVLHKVAGHTPEWGREPLQFATEIFRLRDKLAHGKPERVLGPVVRDIHAAEELCKSDEFQPDWYRRITKEWVLDAQERYRLLMVYLGELFRHHESDHLHRSSGGIITDDEA